MIATVLLKSKLNGNLHKGNYVWGGAMNLCWTELCASVNKGPLHLDLKDELAVNMADNFNNSAFALKDLSEDSYYVRSGYGQETVERINA